MATKATSDRMASLVFELEWLEAAKRVNPCAVYSDEFESRMEGAAKEAARLSSESGVDKPALKQTARRLASLYGQDALTASATDTLRALLDWLGANTGSADLGEVALNLGAASNMFAMVNEERLLSGDELATARTVIKDAAKLYKMRVGEIAE